jgi:hypothetical protein
MMREPERDKGGILNKPKKMTVSNAGYQKMKTGQESG